MKAIITDDIIIPGERIQFIESIKKEDPIIGNCQIIIRYSDSFYPDILKFSTYPKRDEVFNKLKEQFEGIHENR